MKNYTILNTILIINILFISSCDLFTESNTTAPEVNFTILGGNEISRGVTLTLDIIDDSSIETATVMIDDTTAVTAHANFDTIRFDVTPFADESEHQLYVSVEDSEGNIGQSEKLDVVITEFPGWRIYEDLIFNDPYDTPISIDANGILLVGSGMDYNGLFIFDPETDEINNYTSDNSPLSSSYIIDLYLIDDGRVWIANGNNVIEFFYKLNRWERNLNLPPNHKTNDPEEISSIIVDQNYDLWIGTWYGGLYHYRGIEQIQQYYLPEITSYGIHDLVIDKNNVLFAAPEINYGSNKHGVYSIKDGIISTYNFFDDFPWELTAIAVDSSNNIWVGSHGYIFNGMNWAEVLQPHFGSRFDPMLVTSEGILFTQGRTTGLISWNGTEWKDFKNFDSPYKYETDDNLYLAGESLAESPNGDIWMVAGGKLMRYRPSLGGYP